MEAAEEGPAAQRPRQEEVQETADLPPEAHQAVQDRRLRQDMEPVQADRQEPVHPAGALQPADQEVHPEEPGEAAGGELLGHDWNHQDLGPGEVERVHPGYGAESRGEALQL